MMVKRVVRRWPTSTAWVGAAAVAVAVVRVVHG